MLEWALRSVAAEKAVSGTPVLLLIILEYWAQQSRESFDSVFCYYKVC